MRLSLAIVLLSVAASGCGASGELGCLAPGEMPAGRIHLVSHGWHVGLVVDTATVDPGRLPGQFVRARYFEYGWGDSAYYTHPSPGLWTALRAGLLPTPSVLHVVAFSRDPVEYFSRAEVVTVEVGREGLDSLVHFLDNAPRSDTAIGEGLYGESRFLSASGRYHVLNNCNHWTSRALRAAGCPVDPVLTPTSGAVMRRARSFGESTRPPSGP